ncbi:phage tail tape measure protein [Rhodoplanes sp. TEM]|uniref:Phage tail tape measure protein n=1 Tax=Rhodoplanes tepidamans TaxID=200616 RepID=A0ABT5JEC7_RHOTP|nr:MULTISPECIES: phage tail tape measure protein [Rhodoplanes]MDC7787962.1 phage tail tape measure protein [Rhodoplanes tepidamans]MDC7984802.1 phage tail tape measure protein [Rhodoplanes sp. TEM]MDQ0358391.1 hypothetical protein [Rhodoplanes tepidamans]
MNRQLALSVMVRLVDRLSGPIERLMGRVRALGALGGRIGDLTRRVGDLGTRIGAVGAIGAGLSFAAPLQAAAAYDAVVRDIGITADLTGEKLSAMIGTAGPAMEKLSFEVGQRSINLAKALQSLVSSGLDLPTAQGLMRTVGRVATAAGAEVMDVARASFSLSNSLRISVAEMETALAKLVTAGKLGRFEFKDMARELPELTAGIQKFGMSGMEAVTTLGAALQVVMYGTSSPSVAANNLSNLFQKFFGKETIENFKKEFDTDIIGTIQNATARGLNPFEAAMRKLFDKTGISAEEVKKVYDEAAAGGANQLEAFEKVRTHLERIGAAAKIQLVFGDKQALDAIIPFLANLDKYKEFKASIAMADTAIIARDLAGRMAGLTARIEVFAETAEQAMRRVGNAFSTNLAGLTWILQQVMTVVAWLDTAMPGSVDTVLSWGGSLLLAAAGLGLVGKAVGFVAAGIGVLVGLIGGPVVVGFAALAAAITGAAMAVYTYWEPIKGFFAGLWTSIETTFTSFGARIAAWWEGLIPDWARPLIRGAAAVVPGGGLVAAAASAAGPARDGPGPTAQKQEVGGKIVVQVDGPAKITSVTSDSRAVPIEADRGQMLWVP